MAGMRRRARELALQALFEADLSGHNAEQTLEHLLAGAESPAPEEIAQFSRELVLGVVQNKPKIDDTIRRHAPNWPLEQISAVDRNVLRVAIFEILFNNKVPTKVAINEAVDLAKTFGSDNSSKFVNGVLGAVSSQSP